MKRKFKNQIFVIAHNIRSAFNIGSIFRISDAAGINKIYLGGFSPSLPNEKITKVSLGAENYIPFESCRSSSRLIKRLKNEGVKIVALENNLKKGINYLKFKPKYPLVLILGHEVKGLPKSILDLADKIIYLPMYGQKESLNVATAFGIAVYEFNKFRK
ncbi:MAG: TrmH family RNA methyltransferase [Parcubacteria group bacterium]|nr:TrmH family RNA methyltransferase [Parcubacteria group bacterium]